MRALPLSRIQREREGGRSAFALFCAVSIYELRQGLTSSFPLATSFVCFLLVYGMFVCVCVMLQAAVAVSHKLP